MCGIGVEPPQYQGLRFPVLNNQHVGMTTMDAEHYAYVSIRLPGSSSVLGAVMINGAKYVTSGITTLSTSLWDASSNRPVGNRTCVSLLPSDSAIPTSSANKFPPGKNDAMPRSLPPQGRDLPTLTMRNIPFGKDYIIRFEIPSEQTDTPRPPVALPVHVWFDVTGWSSQ
jgi:hypothetical protein